MYLYIIMMVFPSPNRAYCPVITAFFVGEYLHIICKNCMSVFLLKNSDKKEQSKGSIAKLYGLHMPLNIFDSQVQRNFLLDHWPKMTLSKGQKKPKAVWACRIFSPKMNKWICFVCREKQKSKQNKFVRLIFGRIYNAPICFGFI